jgi:hypothetical protein
MTSSKTARSIGARPELRASEAEKVGHEARLFRHSLWRGRSPDPGETRFSRFSGALCGKGCALTSTPGGSEVVSARPIVSGLHVSSWPSCRASVGKEEPPTGRSTTVPRSGSRDAATKVAQHRLSVVELARQPGNVAEACRLRGLDRTSICGWKRRFRTRGSEGLKDLPPIHRSHPQTTPPEVVERIRALALEHPEPGACVRNRLRHRARHGLSHGALCLHHARLRTAADCL